ncbi:MAG TPA: hypothetical protein EYG75_00675 [Campylobacterales bacterium]|nr:hypothetical protein [Campylobacterales bacterium]
MAAVIFESVIKSNPIGRWYIEIRDTSEEGENQICLDINEYATKIEDMGAEHGGNIEVVWSQEENVTPVQINEVRMEMKAYEQKQKDEENNPIPGEASHEMDGSPKF